MNTRLDRQAVVLMALYWVLFVLTILVMSYTENPWALVPLALSLWRFVMWLDYTPKHRWKRVVTNQGQWHQW